MFLKKLIIWTNIFIERASSGFPQHTKWCCHLFTQSETCKSSLIPQSLSSLHFNPSWCLPCGLFFQNLSLSPWYLSPITTTTLVSVHSHVFLWLQGLLANCWPWFNSGSISNLFYIRHSERYYIFQGLSICYSNCLECLSFTLYFTAE